MRFVVCWLFAWALAAAAPVANSPLDSVRFVQRPGAQLPVQDRWLLADGSRRSLAAVLAGRPAVLWFGYDRCPQLCGIVGDGLTETLRRLRPSVGREFSVVAVSLDPADTPRDSAREEARAVGRYGRTGAAAGWHYLTGDAATISALTQAAGFHFLEDPRSRQYAHAAGFVVVTPGGRVSRYFLGVDFPADAVADALEAAAHGGVGVKVFDLVLRCFRGAGIGGRYGPLIWRVLEVAVAGTVLAVFGGIAFLLGQERRRARKPAAHLAA